MGSRSKSFSQTTFKDPIQFLSTESFPKGRVQTTRRILQGRKGARTPITVASLPNSALLCALPDILVYFLSVPRGLALFSPP